MLLGLLFASMGCGRVSEGTPDRSSRIDLVVDLEAFSQVAPRGEPGCAVRREGEGPPEPRVAEHRVVGEDLHLDGVFRYRAVRQEPHPPDADPERYREALRSVLANLERGGQGAAGAAASRLRSLEPIAMADGTRVRPDVGDIVGALEAQPPDLDGARARLRALLAELDRVASRPSGRWDRDPGSSLKGVLERPEFRTDREPDPVAKLFMGFWGTVLDWIGRVLGPILGWLGEMWGRAWDGIVGPENRDLPWGILGLILIVGLAVYVIRGLRRAMGSAPVGIEAARVATISAVQLRAEGLRLAGGGDFRGAMRALYLAALLRWDELGRLRFDRSLTNREVLARVKVGADPALVDLLAPLVERFDRFWYAGVPCSSEDYVGFARLAAMAWETE